MCGSIFTPDPGRSAGLTVGGEDRRFGLVVSTVHIVHGKWTLPPGGGNPLGRPVTKSGIRTPI